MQNDNGSEQQRLRQIGAASVDFEALTIEGPDGVATLEPKVIGVLAVLVAEAPEVVSREALIERVWGHESGGDESLSRAVSLLRKAFGDRRGQHHHIETIPRRGYRLVAPLAAPESGIENPATAGSGRIRPVLWVVPAALLGLGIALWATLSGTTELQPTVPADVSAVLPERTIAVLPFSDLSPSGDQGYFADGLAEEILSALAGIPELKVAGRTSSFAYRGRDVDVRTLGTELNVRHVLEGSVRKEGDDLRITAQLVRTDDGYHSWSRSFDGGVDRVFDFQEQIARDIAQALAVTLTPDAASRLAQALTHSREAYDAFLQGRSLARRFGPAEKIRAAELLEQAVALDPTFALAWAELARTELFVPVSNPERDAAPHIARARQAAGRALALDPELAMGHYVQGLIHESDVDYAAAMRAVSTAHRLAPRNPFLTIRYGYYLALLGDLERGAEVIEQGLRLDPTDAAGIANLGAIRFALGDLEAAERLLRRSVDLGFLPASGYYSLVLGERGQTEQVMDVWRGQRVLADRYVPSFNDPALWERFGVAMSAPDTGMDTDRDNTARAEFATALETYLAEDGVRANSYRLFALVRLGRPAAAMRWLIEKPHPINAGFVSFIWFDQFGFKALRTHPDFPGFAERIGLVAAWDEYGWPPQCQRTPQLEDSTPAFHCE